MVSLVQYCPKCHKKMNVPKFINMVNVVNGITIKCGDNNCSGVIKIKSKQKQEV